MVNVFSINSQVAEKAEDARPILIGAVLPNAELKDENGSVVNLSNVINSKPTILVFYRGSWCPFCNKHLEALAKSQEEIIKLGYQIVAISPDDYQNLKPMVKTDSLNYKLYSDPDGKLIQQIGLAFKASDKTKSYIATKTIGKTTEILPVPTLMIVNGKSEILFEYVNPDVKNRITQKLLLVVLKNLN
jgi:peroxiredoxin